MRCTKSSRDIAHWRECAERALVSADEVGDAVSADFALAALAAANARKGRGAETIDLLKGRRQRALAAIAGASLLVIDVSLAKARLALGQLPETQAALLSWRPREPMMACTWPPRTATSQRSRSSTAMARARLAMPKSCAR